jgi:hypothetical protein
MTGTEAGGRSAMSRPQTRSLPSKYAPSPRKIPGVVEPGRFGPRRGRCRSVPLHVYGALDSCMGLWDPVLLALDSSLSRSLRSVIDAYIHGLSGRLTPTSHGSAKFGSDLGIQPCLYLQNQPVHWPSTHNLILLYLFGPLPAELLLYVLPGRQPRAESQFVDHREFLEVHLIELHNMAFSMMNSFDWENIVQLTELITKMSVFEIYAHSTMMHKLI